MRNVTAYVLGGVPELLFSCSFSSCNACFLPYPLSTMPRGKRTVFAMFCSETGLRLGSIRFHRQDKQGKGWKEHAEGFMKYCPALRKRVAVKFKEEKHSS